MLKGLFIGLSINFCATIIISLFIGHGEYMFVTQKLIESRGNEINAVFSQGLTCMIIGAISSVAWLLFSFEELGFLVPSFINFFVFEIMFLISSKINSWLEITNFGYIVIAFCSLIIFLLLYAIRCTIIYYKNKAVVYDLNVQLKKKYRKRI